MQLTVDKKLLPVPVNTVAKTSELVLAAALESESNPVLQDISFDQAYNYVKVFVIRVCESEGVGADNLPSSEVLQLTTQAIQLMNIRLTVNELSLAYTLAASGQLKCDTTMYQYFNMQVVKRLLSAYQSYRYKVKEQANQILLPAKEILKPSFFRFEQQIIDFLVLLQKANAGNLKEEEDMFLRHFPHYEEVATWLIDLDLARFTDVSAVDYLNAEYVVIRSEISRRHIMSGQRISDVKLHEKTRKECFKKLVYLVFEQHQKLTPEQLSIFFNQLIIKLKEL